MNKTFKNFKRLSAKQIKTYAALLLISAFSFQAIASTSENEVNPESEMSETIEASLNEEFILENWMASPFEVAMEKTEIMDAPVSIPSTEFVEMELALESWMALPFTYSIIDESYIEEDMCNAAP